MTGVTAARAVAALPDALTVSASEATVAGALRVAAERLRVSGSPSPRLDAEVLAAHVLGRDRAWLLAHPEAALESEAAVRLTALVERRATGEPIAYIRGFKDWLSLRIRTDARALIPRPETELLAEAAIAELATRLAEEPVDEPIVAWDVGTGTACLAVALGLRFRTSVTLGRVRLIASDASGDALRLAWENLAAHGLASLVELVPGNLLQGAGEGLPLPHLIVANLPYVPTADLPGLPVAASFEPRAALDGGPDGLAVTRSLLAQLPERLAPGGAALLEIGVGQADAVRAAAREGGFATTQTRRDLAGVERVVRIQRAREPQARGSRTEE